jgi:hypothetical protein
MPSKKLIHQFEEPSQVTALTLEELGAFILNDVVEMARFRNFAAAGIADVDIDLGKDGGEKESESLPLPCQPHKHVLPSATLREKTLR